MKTNTPNGLRLMALSGLAMLLATGCQTYEGKNKAASVHWQRGEVEAAAKVLAAKVKQEKDTKDTIIWQLELAAALRAARQHRESLEALEAAEEKINKYDKGAKVKIGSEALGMLANQQQLPYEGRAYDKIMLNTYKALNYLQLGEPDKARVEFIRSQQRQDEAVEINKARIEKAEAQMEKAKEKKELDPDKIKEDPKFKGQFDGAYAFLDQYKAEANYKNPAAVYLHGLFFMAAATGPADLEMAKHSFDEVAGMMEENKFVKTDRELLEQALAGKALPPATYVIFETGRAPIRGQIRIDIPTFWPKLPYLGAAFPKLNFQTNYLTNLRVSGGDVSETTQVLANMDTVVSRDFKNELPTIITKTLISTALKATSLHFAWEATRKKNQNGRLDDGGWAGMLVLTTGTIAWAASNIADTRTWTTLPKEFQVCRVPTPADRKIQLAGPDGQLKTDVTLEEGAINLVYVKAINASSPLIITQIKLK